MAAEIHPKSVKSSGGIKKPELINKLTGCNDEVNMAIFIPNEDGIISVSDDRTVRIWLKRSTGQYWPSICHTMPGPASSVSYHGESRNLFIGLESGSICEFSVAQDFNSMAAIRNYLAHQNRVTDIHYDHTNNWLLSCARDKYFTWHCTRTGRRMGGFQTTAWCTCLKYDNASKFAFIGDYSGQITVLKIDGSSFQVITVLKGHTGSVRCLAWDAERSLLFSGSFDNSVIIWDIGGQKGSAVELQGHHDRVQSLFYCSSSHQLLSGGDDCILGIWEMNVTRQETPEWEQSDNCQKCGHPFFWNVKSMWEQKAVGVRQHHCRKCGNALCSKCSPGQAVLPTLGYEYEVRVCENCEKVITDVDRTPLASFHDIKVSIKFMHLDFKKKTLLTVSPDRIIRIWDLKTVIK